MTQQVLIHGGLLVDGTGSEPREADVEIVDGKITRIGQIAPGRHEMIDARGCIVTPGFVDIHTHYDGHVMWDTSLAPTSMHGVTSAVMGNCGVGFAPCNPEHREMLVELMEAIEDIPEAVLNAGLPWNWRSFPDYLEVLASKHFDIDVAAQVPHGALRVNVMGERAVRREVSTDEDRAEMQRLVREAVHAGAVGFSSSRIRAHKTRSGNFTPDYLAAEDELLAIAMGLKLEGKGVLQFVTDISDQHEPGVAEFNILRRLVQKSGRPLSLNITQREIDPDGWKRLMAMIGEANNQGISIKGQIMGRPIGLVLGFELTQNPFMAYPSFEALAKLPFADKVRRLADPAVRRSILAEQANDPELGGRVAAFDRLFEVDDNPDYEPPTESSIAARARHSGIGAAAYAYDVLMKNGGHGLLYRPVLNYAAGNLDAVHEMLTDPNGVPGLSDGGAHCGMTCDSSITTFNLAYWTRDRKLGPRLSLAKVVKGHTADTAAVMGFRDRGLIAPGMKGDVNVIDYDRLRLYPVEVVYDMPAGGRRLVQRATGYKATLVSGVPIVRDDQHTGARPGRLVRAQ
ncbi:MAG: N-acyl-D-amino-acid deacylase family protein [Burkholderiaceae bacterium]